MKKNFANEFAKIAASETVLSEVMTDREKISTEEVCKKFPDGITITEFDIISQGDKAYPVFAIAEDPKICFFGGMVLYKIANAWIDAFDGDMTECQAQLAQCGGVKIKLIESKTASGRNITKVEVIG